MNGPVSCDVAPINFEDAVAGVTADEIDQLKKQLAQDQRDIGILTRRLDVLEQKGGGGT
jgi:NADH/NAD ratio-sensing transcriptional regulator Rex